MVCHLLSILIINGVLISMLIEKSMFLQFVPLGDLNFKHNIAGHKFAGGAKERET